MEIRNTRVEDLDAVMQLYAAAREFMHHNGNPTQWVNGYPQQELISGEIEEKKSFGCVDDGAIVAVFSFILGDDPTYAVIHDGDWLDHAPYGVVHRICVGKRGAGIGTFCLRWCLEQCGNVRIDTHRDNLPMQALVKKCGYAYCGWITIQDGSERLAFQKRI